MNNHWKLSGFATIVTFLIVSFLNYYVIIELPFGNARIQFGYAFLALLAGIAGPVVTAIVGFISVSVSDIVGQPEQWLALALVAAVLGYVYGVAVRRPALHSGVFSRHDALRFNVIQVVAHVILLGLVLPTLEVFFYQEATEIVFIGGWVSSMMNSIVVAIVATFLFKSYALYRNRQKHLE